MFERLFGTTREDQMRFLEPRIWGTVIAVIAAFVAMIFVNESAVGIIAIAAYAWAWTFMKNWFGITAIGALLSRNVLVGVLLFMAYLFVGYFIGIITFLLGLIRYIQLKIQGKQCI